MLLLPVVFKARVPTSTPSTPAPTATFAVPVVLDNKVPLPTAVLFELVVFPPKALSPIAVLPAPVVFAYKD